MTRPERRRPLAISAPSRELNDIQATRSPSAQPRLVNTLATRLACRCRVAKSRILSPKMNAGLSGSESAWLARKSNSIALMLRVRRARGRGMTGRRARRRPGRTQRVLNEADRRGSRRDAAADHHAIAQAA